MRLILLIALWPIVISLSCPQPTLGQAVGQTIDPPRAVVPTRQDPPATDGSGAEALTVMTWNLEWFYDEQQGDNFSDLAKEKSSPDRSAWDWRRDAIAASVAAARPTVLALQEVENRRVLWYLAQALRRQHHLQYSEAGLEGRDYFTEQDVGLMVRPPADTDSLVQHGYPRRLRSSNQFYDVSKHLQAEIEFQHGNQSHRVLLLNVHLRARPEAEAFRIRQARLLQHWLSDAIRSGQNVIVLGDFNSEETSDQSRPDSDLGIVCGLETDDPNDDLVDLTLQLPGNERQTHLLPGRQYDRILCSRSLLEDDPSRPDLVFSKIEILEALCVRGTRDDPQQHWESYWELPESERDLSDHFPVMATFEVR